jgi:hypothetical protein
VKTHRLLAILALVALVTMTLAPVASATAITPERLNGNPDCAFLGYDNEFKVDPSVAGYTYNGTYQVAGFGSISLSSPDNVFFDWTSTFGIDAVIAKGGNYANVFRYSPSSLGDTGLYPPTKDGGYYGLSHVTFCYNDGPGANVTIAKDCLAYTSPSQNYRMAVTNLGPGSAREVTLTDTFPTGVDIDPLEYTSYLITTANGVVPQGACSKVGQVLTCQLSTLLPSLTMDATAKWVVSVSFDGGPGGLVLNTATVAAANDTNAANNSDTAICETSNAVDLVSFTAVGGESSVAVAWETASEIDSVGFNLYRRGVPPAPPRLCERRPDKAQWRDHPRAGDGIRHGRHLRLYR